MNLNEKLQKLMSDQPSKWRENAAERMATAGWRKNSIAVALRVLTILREKEMTQSALAELMGVSRQQISKIVSGSENLTFETIDKLEKALGAKLMIIEGGSTPPAAGVVQPGPDKKEGKAPRKAKK
ncbi:XRE family transcriptional regulator [Chitinophaga lutea]|uniref:XRE family transcriptional regulator n=1 Tax=Chitinophaga lutea TaxID=2488634 RepID=A0A3N4PSW7_9BACT|nr:helix-turn-helix transcriptional regulator [Chitinophaga lutea]RPE08101.1 XRE family transcriptional regulator [Chitinophaga lutea]